MFYYLYETKNLINNKIYVGVHKTNNLNDGYMGSGKVLRYAMEKHGIENFTKVILEQFDDSAAMYAREKEVVTDEFLLREDIYNLRRGGSGGFDYINKNESLRISKNKKARHSTNNVLLAKYGDNYLSIIGKRGLAKCKELKVGIFSESFVHKGFTDDARENARSKESILKRKVTFARIGHQQGEKNSNFGTMWITNGVENKKIKKDEPIPKFWEKGRVMK
jgi:hypothetical protein